MKRLGAVLAGLAGSWLLVFLWTTPRGDRILTRASETLWPDSLTK